MPAVMDAAMHLYARGDDPLIIYAPSTGPYTTPALTANMVCRVILSLVANMFCLVPLRLLYRNGEFAAVVLIINVMIQNFETIVNCFLWGDDNVEEWWPGYGLCDLGSYWDNFLTLLYATCLLAIMRNLARQVALLSANPLTLREKRKRNYVQALIMFPLPIILVGMTWPLTAQRYAIVTLLGCRWVGHGSWPYLVFNVLPLICVPMATTVYAVLAYFRFRQLAKTTECALSGNRLANQRAQRTRRRLYFMVVSIMVPYLPMCIFLFVGNLIDTPIKPFDYEDIHNDIQTSTGSQPWNSILYLRSTDIKSYLFNLPYMAIFTVIPIFLFFGMTKDALNDYRKAMIFIGLDTIFPTLRQEHGPDRAAFGSSGSFGSSLRFTSNPSVNHSKLKSFMSHNPLRTINSSFSEGDNTLQSSQSFNFLTAPIQEQGQATPLQRPEPAQHPFYHSDPIQLPHRNPLLFRTTLDFPTIPFFNPFKSKSKTQTQPDVPIDPLSPGQEIRWTSTTDPSAFQTRVWSDDETRLYSYDETAIDRRATVSLAHGIVVETMYTRKTEEARR